MDNRIASPNRLNRESKMIVQMLNLASNFRLLDLTVLYVQKNAKDTGIRYRSIHTILDEMVCSRMWGRSIRPMCASVVGISGGR